MQFTVKKADVTTVPADVLFTYLFEGTSPLEGVLKKIDQKLNGHLSTLIKRKELTGKSGEITSIHTLGKLKTDKLVILGLGKSAKYDTNKTRLAGSDILRKAKAWEAKNIITLLPGTELKNLDNSMNVSAFAEGMVMGSYEFKKYQSGKSNAVKSRDISIEIIVPEEQDIPGTRGNLKVGQIVGESVNYAKELVNEPPNILTPSELGRRCQLMAKETGLKCTVLDKKAIQKLKMGGLLGVNAGSTQEPRFIIMEYVGNKSSKVTTGLVGKGLTFDAGGISLKPAQNMHEMKSDMSGAAAVIGAMRAVALLKPKVNVTALVPATENMPDGNACRPADILTSMSGKTIEILNTDAEGRLILADALHYAKTRKLAPVIDVATLTGACSIALGPFTTGLFTNNADLEADLWEAAQQSGEKLWAMPMDEEYGDLIKSKIADVKNTGGREGGAITAAKFLEVFIEPIPWAHLDIAATAYSESPKGYDTYGGTGVGVRTFIRFLLNKANQ